jgi:NSS family neurotransmitter:Na+ symporter
MRRNLPKEHWSSHLMFIIACISSAVGLGNIWRISYTAGIHGGGNFLVLYVLAVILVGIPALLVELTVGKTIRENASGAFKKMLGKNWWLVLFPLGLTLLVFSYYLVVTGWTIFYAATSLFGIYIPFNEATGTWWLALGGLVSLAICELVSRVNIKDGLEKVNFYLFPVFIVSLLLLFINSLSLAGAQQSFTYLTTFDSSELLSPLNITAAISQAIFSLSVGFTAMLTYASYARKKEEIFKSSLIVVGTDVAVGLMSTFAIFAIAFTFMIPVTAGPPLAFDALPQAFLAMPYGFAIMSVFFLLLFSVAITSAVSMSEILVDNLRRRTDGRNRAGLIMLALALILFIPAALSYSPIPVKVMGIRFLDFLDADIVGRFAPLVVVISLVAFTWFWKDCKKALSQNVPAILVDPIYLMVKYVAPAAILLLLVADFLVLK